MIIILSGGYPKEEAIKQLKESGFENAEMIVDKWGTPVQSSRTIKSSLSDYFPVSEEEADDLNDLANTFTSKSDLRSVLEDYFHIYDDLAEMSVQEFDSYLADYFNSETHPED